MLIGYLMRRFRDVWHVFLDIKPEMCALFLNFLVTLSVFPGLTALIRPIDDTALNATDPGGETNCMVF